MAESNAGTSLWAVPAAPPHTETIMISINRTTDFQTSGQALSAHRNIHEDGKWRTNKYQSTTLFFSANEVHCYTYSYSTTEEKKTESTDVYFYKDIVSVSTASDTIKYPEETKETEYEYFKLTTTGGTALSVTLRDKDGAQESINNMRKLLKQKKTI